MSKIERTLGEVYRDDPERADAVVFGRRTGVSRRGFLGGSGMAAMSAAVGGPIVFGAAMPGGLIPAALAQEAKTDPPAEAAAPKGPQLLQFPGKDGNLVLLGDKPLVAETPEQLLKLLATMVRNKLSKLVRHEQAECRDQRRIAGGALEHEVAAVGASPSRLVSARGGNTRLY